MIPPLGIVLFNLRALERDIQLQLLRGKAVIKASESAFPRRENSSDDYRIEHKGTERFPELTFTSPSLPLVVFGNTLRIFETRM